MRNLKHSVLFLLVFPIMLLVAVTILTGCQKQEEVGTEQAPKEATSKPYPKASEASDAVITHEIPSFPWPPPKASAASELPDKFLRGVTSEQIYLRDIDSRISFALENTGYFEKCYFAVPDGFALVTRLEQINEDGSPKSPPQRWSVDVKPLKDFSLSSYLRALFTSDPGYFRVIVFITTHYPFSQSDIPIDSTQAVEWLHKGLNKLPESIGKLSYTDNYSCTALVYEFKKVRSQEQNSVNILLPGRLSGREHLVSSKLWSYLER